jgi:hypothetical protein
VLLIWSVLVVVRPLTVCWSLLLRCPCHFSRTIESYFKRMWFDNEQCLSASDLRKIPCYLFLSLDILFVLLAAISYFFRWGEQGVEQPEVGPRCPCRTGAVEGSFKYTANPHQKLFFHIVDMDMSYLCAMF